MKTLSTILLSIVLASCVTTPQKREPIPVEAGHFYPGSYINVRAPNSEGWHLVNSSPAGMEFARFGLNENETFGAQLLMFSLIETKNKEDFVALVKKGIELDSDPSRFKIISSEYLYSDSRGYPCVNVESTVNDTKAKVQGNKLGDLLLQSVSLYCRHPVRTDTGFSATYSHRGTTLYKQLYDEAIVYIEGIQVPENAQ